MLEIFAPYLPFVTILVTILVNILLIKMGASWLAYLIANVIIVLTFEMLGVNAFNFIGRVVELIVDIIMNIISQTIDKIFNRSGGTTPDGNNWWQNWWNIWPIL